MDILSFSYIPNGCEQSFDYKLLAVAADNVNQTLSGYVVSKLTDEELKEVKEGRATKEINRKAYRTFKTSKIRT